MSVILRKYGVQDTVKFPIKKAGLADFAGSADWTPARGDVKVSIDGGDYANTTNLPTALGGSGSKGWILTLTAAELTGKQIDIQIVDSATKAVDDQAIKLETYGHASAQWVFDLGVDLLTVVAQEILDALRTDTLPELGSVPSATPTFAQAEMLKYMALRNQIIVDNNTKLQKIYNDAGTAIAQALYSDVAGIYTRAKLS